MTKDSDGENRGGRLISGKFRGRNWMFEIEPYSRLVSVEDVTEDLELKRVLKRAVVSTARAPEYLVGSIRAGIRR
jgi:hypothetical protein